MANTMKKSYSTILIMMTLSTTVLAEKVREQQFEVFFAPYYVASKELTFDNDALLVLNEHVGWSLGLGFNFTDKVSGELQFSTGSGKYAVSAVRDDGTQHQYIEEMDSSSLMVGMTYNLFDDAFTPYVSGNLGISFVDTGVADGGGYPSCWYDPWYGEVCSTYETTKTTTQLSFGASTGVRYDFDNELFVKGGVGVNIVTFNSSSLPYFLTGQIAVGSRF